MEKVAILLNPASGRGRSQKKRKRIEHTFETFGIPYDLFISNSENNLRELSNQVLERYQTIVGAGGDTTFNMIASEILEKDIPAEDSPNLGFFGTGSANDICQSLGTESLKDICDSIINSRVKKMDAGRVRIKNNNRQIFFLGSMSLGLGATVNAFVEEFSGRHKFLSKNLFLVQAIGGGLGVWNSFSKKKVPLTVSLEFDNKFDRLDFSLLVFLNTNFYARGLNLSPETTPFDGKIDCIAMNTSSFFKTAKLRFSVKRGKHLGKKELQMIRSERFFLKTENKIDMQLDGEIIKGVNECEISVLPGVLNVLVK